MCAALLCDLCMQNAYKRHTTCSMKFMLLSVRCLFAIVCLASCIGMRNECIICVYICFSLSMLAICILFAFVCITQDRSMSAFLALAIFF